MKTTSVLLLATSAAALALVALNLAIGASLLFAAGFAAIIFNDYTRATRRLKLPATVALGSRTEKFGLAA